MINLTPVLRFALMLVRPGTLITFAPAFGGASVPAPAKIGLTMILAAAMTPLTALPAAGGPLPIALIVSREVAIGFALALAMQVLIAGAEFAGHLAGFQMGLSYGATVDPQSGVRNPLLSVLYGNMARVTFLLVGGHHAFLRALHQSYTDFPPGAGGVNASLPQSVADMLGFVFVFGVRLAAPVVLALVVVELAMALLARSAPALNLMAIGAPVRLMVGLLLLAAIVPTITSLVAGSSGSILRLAVRAAGAFK